MSLSSSVQQLVPAAELVSCELLQQGVDGVCDKPCTRFIVKNTGNAPWPRTLGLAVVAGGPLNFATLGASSTGTTTVTTTTSMSMSQADTAHARDSTSDVASGDFVTADPLQPGDTCTVIMHGPKFCTARLQVGSGLPFGPYLRYSPQHAPPPNPFLHGTPSEPASPAPAQTTAHLLLLPARAPNTNASASASSSATRPAASQANAGAAVVSAMPQRNGRIRVVIRLSPKAAHTVQHTARASTDRCVQHGTASESTQKRASCPGLPSSQQPRPPPSEETLGPEGSGTVADSKHAEVNSTNTRGGGDGARETRAEHAAPWPQSTPDPQGRSPSPPTRGLGVLQRDQGHALRPGQRPAAAPSAHAASPVPAGASSPPTAAVIAAPAPAAAAAAQRGAGATQPAATLQTMAATAASTATRQTPTPPSPWTATTPTTAPTPTPHPAPSTAMVASTASQTARAVPPSPSPSSTSSSVVMFPTYAGDDSTAYELPQPTFDVAALVENQDRAWSPPSSPFADWTPVAMEADTERDEPAGVGWDADTNAGSFYGSGGVHDSSDDAWYGADNDNGSDSDAVYSRRRRVGRTEGARLGAYHDPYGPLPMPSATARAAPLTRSLWGAPEAASSVWTDVDDDEDDTSTWSFVRPSAFDCTSLFSPRLPSCLRMFDDDTPYAFPSSASSSPSDSELRSPSPPHRVLGKGVLGRDGRSGGGQWKLGQQRTFASNEQASGAHAATRVQSTNSRAFATTTTLAHDADNGSSDNDSSATWGEGAPPFDFDFDRPYELPQPTFDVSKLSLD